jgi:hypothetical protein
MENQNQEAAPQGEAPQTPASITYEGIEFDPAYVARYTKEEWAEHGQPRFYAHYEPKEQAKVLARVWDLAQPIIPKGTKK